MIRAAAVALAAGALLLLVAAPAGAGRIAVGVTPGSDRTALAERLREHGATRIVDLAPLPALVVSASSPSALRSVPGAGYIEPLPVRRRSYVPNDPLFPRQWYATQIRSFDAWSALPPLAGVRVAVIDSGVDGSHPELHDRIVASRSFVGGSATVDTEGHGTFVAGLIAATTDDGIGMAGLAPPAELLVAKVVGRGGTIGVEAEAKALRWAVENHARVINMSLGGLRDPGNPGRDSYSQLEADAVAYAVSKGVLVVAAVGNSDQSPAQPWPYASWPAALPHVLGVSALSRSGASPSFSNRDIQFNDIAAPGEDIISTLPLAMTAARPGCLDQGYSLCGPDEYRPAEGTSFAAPQVTAAATMLIATDPTLTPDQVISLLQQSAVDAVAATGCASCATGRDRFTGAGRVDQVGAFDLLTAAAPPRDAFEPNDRGGTGSYPLFGASRRVEATLDFWNDRDDVYRTYVRTGEHVTVSVAATTSVLPALSLWRPGTETVDSASAPVRRLAARPPGVTLAYTARVAGWYILKVRAPRAGVGAYTITVAKAG